MRYIMGLVVALLALVIGAGTTSALQVPSGSYQQTCRNIGVQGNTLYAECQDTGGYWRSTQLPDYQRCRGEIQNLNGSLQCTGGGPGYGPDHDGDRARGHNYRGNRDDDGDWDWDRDHHYRIPRGSYVQTCQDVRVNNNEIQARCQKRNGGWRNTKLRNFTDCRDIENDNGKLRCR